MNRRTKIPLSFIGGEGSTFPIRRWPDHSFPMATQAESENAKASLGWQAGPLTKTEEQAVSFWVVRELLGFRSAASVKVIDLFAFVDEKIACLMD